LDLAGWLIWPDLFFPAKNQLINQIGLGRLANFDQIFFFPAKNQLTNQIGLGQLANFGQIFFSWLKLIKSDLAGWLIWPDLFFSG